MRLIRTAARRLAAASFGLFVILLLGAHVRAQDIGYVLDISGDWYLNGGTRLGKFNRLPANGVIRTDSPSEISNFIVVANRSGSVIARRECKKQDECNNAINLPEEPSVIKQFFESVMGKLGLQTESSKYTTTASKSSELNEAVVKLENNVLDLEQVFKHADAKTYHLRFEPLGQGGAAADKPTVPVAFKWDPERASPLGVCDLKAGVYKVSLLQPQGEGFDETGMDVWILVSNAEQYESASNQFGEAVKLTGQWGKQVKPNTARSFLRATLDLLAAQQK